MNNQGFPNYFQFPIIVPEYFSEDELFNNPLYFLKKDENGSKIIQDLYKKLTPNEKNQVFNKIKSKLKELSKNESANHPTAALIEENDNEKINFIYNSLKDDLIEFYFGSTWYICYTSIIKKT